MTLLMREKEIARDNFEEGFKEGVKEVFKEAREEAIKILIKKYKKIGLNEEEIIEELKEYYKMGGNYTTRTSDVI